MGEYLGIENAKFEKDNLDFLRRIDKNVASDVKLTFTYFLPSTKSYWAPPSPAQTELGATLAD